MIRDVTEVIPRNNGPETLHAPGQWPPRRATVSTGTPDQKDVPEASHNSEQASATIAIPATRIDTAVFNAANETRFIGGLLRSATVNHRTCMSRPPVLKRTHSCARSSSCGSVTRARARMHRTGNLSNGRSQRMPLRSEGGRCGHWGGGSIWAAWYAVHQHLTSRDDRPRKLTCRRTREAPTRRMESGIGGMATGSSATASSPLRPRRTSSPTSRLAMVCSAAKPRA